MTATGGVTAGGGAGRPRGKHRGRCVHRGRPARGGDPWRFRGGPSAIRPRGSSSPPATRRWRLAEGQIEQNRLFRADSVAFWGRFSRLFGFQRPREEKNPEFCALRPLFRPRERIVGARVVGAGPPTRRSGPRPGPPTLNGPAARGGGSPTLPARSPAVHSRKLRPPCHTGLAPDGRLGTGERMGKQINWARFVPSRDWRTVRSDSDPPPPMPRPVRPRDFHLRGQADLSAACLCPDTRRTHGPARCPHRPVR